MSDRSPSLFARLMTPKDWLATFIAVLALLTSVWSGNATRTYNRLAARPHVQIAWYFASSSPRLGSQVFNLGPGIAIVDEFDLSWNGNPDRIPLTGTSQEQWQQFIKATGAEGWTNPGWLRKGDTLAANPSGAAEILLIVDETKYSQKISKQWMERSDLMRKVLQQLTVRIRYHSVYGEYFEIQNAGYETTRYSIRDGHGQYVEWQP
jgi:hypothetical protein